MIPLKQRTCIVLARPCVLKKRIFKAKGPGEVEMARVCAGQGGGLEYRCVVCEEAGTEGGPGEEVDGDWVVDGGLGLAVGGYKVRLEAFSLIDRPLISSPGLGVPGFQPFGHLVQFLFGCVEIVLFH